MIALIGAMPEEVKAIRDHMKNAVCHTYKKQKFYVGNIGRRKCIATQCGVGKTNAAVTAAILMERYPITGVINVGIAGGLDPQEEVFDIVISERTAHHDIDIPGGNWPKGFDQKKTCFRSDAHYVKTAKQVMKKMHQKAWIGDMVSGDQFVYRTKQINEILKNYPTALCAEMEGASIAQVCSRYQVPFIVIRSLSDIARKKDNEKSADFNVGQAAEASALFCEKFLEEI